ncbi:HutD/Ves family protein [Streptomyces sp. SP18CS02]|uniref:HutD/Ves family protein n=1 Tax=Streptomyces sp. SP18CS02 TaxID=3002531 RepID=UPI002E78A2E0|nr:HutD family protein [Streptomyces sp. SP18CS02]MEE1755000.1 HutD family protein [Streptomyces sp. SP18CS02]
MTVRVLRAAGRRAVPWKNGGGITREIAAAPEGAAVEAFAWRVSLADVVADGPFSVFPDVDRILTVVAGTGMDLTVGDGCRVLAERHAPRCFPGDLPTEGRLLEGPVVNLNVMVRRGAVAATVAVVRGGRPVTVPDGATVLVVALGGTARLGGTELAPYDAALCTRSPGELHARGHAAVITLHPLG